MVEAWKRCVRCRKRVAEESFSCPRCNKRLIFGRLKRRLRFCRSCQKVVVVSKITNYSEVSGFVSCLTFAVTGGTVLIGAILVSGRGTGDLPTVLGFVAIVFAMINVVGGFMVTGRMLRMFKRKPGEQK